MKKILKSVRWVVVLALALVLMTVSAAAVLADWNVGDDHKMHWPQLPVLENGVAVQSTLAWGSIVADDFECTESGPITDIHVWGSWFCDVASPDPLFEIGIWSDIPDDPSNPDDYSMPGERLWLGFFTSDNYTVSPWKTLSQEQLFYGPVLGLPWWGWCGRQVYQYNFYIDPGDAFIQEAGTIYWLSVQEVSEPCGLWGWNNSQDQWNDDAAWSWFPYENWYEVLRPVDPWESLDMAFVNTYFYVITDFCRQHLRQKSVIT